MSKLKDLVCFLLTSILILTSFSCSRKSISTTDKSNNTATSNNLDNNIEISNTLKLISELNFKVIDAKEFDDFIYITGYYGNLLDDGILVSYDKFQKRIVKCINVTPSYILQINDTDIILETKLEAREIICIDRIAFNLISRFPNYHGSFFSSSSKRIYTYQMISVGTMQINCFDIATGKELWIYPPNKAGYYLLRTDSLFEYNDKTYLFEVADIDFTGNIYLVTLSAVNGKVMRKDLVFKSIENMPEIYGLPNISTNKFGETFYAAARTNDGFAFSRLSFKDGKEIVQTWHQKLKPSIDILHFRIFGPETDGDKLYILIEDYVSEESPHSKFILHAFDIKNGMKLMWKETFEADYIFSIQGIIKPNYFDAKKEKALILILGTRISNIESSLIFSINKDSGELLWKKTLSMSWDDVKSNIVHKYGSLYLLLHPDKFNESVRYSVITVFDAETGKEIFSYKLSDTNNESKADNKNNDNYLFFTNFMFLIDQNALLLIRSDGNLYIATF